MPSTLLIPGFLRDHQAAGRPRLPMLERMLARATAQPTRHTHTYLASLFGLGGIAVAPFTRLADGGSPDGGYWLRADPVHLAPDRDQLVLMPPTALEVSPEETQALAEAFNSTYANEGWHLEFPHPERGYLKAPKRLDVLTHDPEPFVGGPVIAAMPEGPDGRDLKQLMNETQMLFHTHPVNGAREDAGRPAINSLWFWGGGVLPAKTDVAPERIHADLPLVRGLAIWAGKELRTPNRNANWEAGDLFALGGRNDPLSLDRDWFGPLLRDLQQGHLKQLHIHLGGLGDFELDTAASHRFWRRGGPLVHP